MTQREGIPYPNGHFDLYEICKDIRAVVDYDWQTEERDYEECAQNGNDQDGHVFERLQRIDAWLTSIGVPGDDA